MGKRSEFERKPRDYYPTPIEAVYPLLGHLKEKATFCEPCAGDGRLIKHIEKYGHSCVFAGDIEPQADNIETYDALWALNEPLPQCDYIITNPPWTRDVLHQMIESFRVQHPTWLLFDSDWMFCKQAKLYLDNCRKIVSIGRVSWEQNGTSGMDNCAWYLFDKDEYETVFIGR